LIISGTPLERLETVMTKAKESGLSADKIFSFFKGGEKLNRSVRLTKEEFLSGLEKLGDNVFVLTSKELDELVEKFDTDGDGMISLDEFRTYCLFQIPSLAWRAERQRMEKSGEMELLKARLSSRLSELSRFVVPCGDEFCSTSKLFWRTQANIRIHMFYCEPMDIITIQLCLENAREEMSPIYVRKKDCMISKTELDDAVTTAVQTSDTRTDEEKDEIGKKTELDFYAKYLISRIQLKESRIVAPTSGTPLGIKASYSEPSYVPFLSKLSGKLCLKN